MTDFDWEQIEAAAQGHGNALKEWPFLIRALKKAGHDPDPNADARSVQNLCSELLKDR